MDTCSRRCPPLVFKYSFIEVFSCSLPHYSLMSLNIIDILHCVPIITKETLHIQLESGDCTIIIETINMCLKFTCNVNHLITPIKISAYGNLCCRNTLLFVPPTNFITLIGKFLATAFSRPSSVLPAPSFHSSRIVKLKTGSLQLLAPIE